MKKQVINAIADRLVVRMEGINDWIRNNPNTDPNFYEIMDCKIEVGKIISDMSKYYDENGYPKKNDGTSSSYTHYEICNFNEHAKKANDELLEMINLRSSGINEVLTDIPEIADLWSEISHRTLIAEYHDPKGNMSEIKKQILCKSVSIPFYIWQERRTNPNFQYDNSVEFNELKEMFDLYSTQVGVQTVNHHPDGSTYAGPQFGEEIEKLIDYIQNFYKYSTKHVNNKVKVKEKRK